MALPCQYPFGVSLVGMSAFTDLPSALGWFGWFDGFALAQFHLRNSQSHLWDIGSQTELQSGRVRCKPI